MPPLASAQVLLDADAPRGSSAGGGGEGNPQAGESPQATAHVEVWGAPPAPGAQYKRQATTSSLGGLLFGEGRWAWMSLAFQTACLAVLATWLLEEGREALDSTVARVWAWVLALPPTRWALAEALVATVSFWVVAIFYETVHIFFPAVLHYRIRVGHGQDGKKDPTEDRPTPAFATRAIRGAPSGGDGRLAEAGPSTPLIKSATFFLVTKIGATLIYLGAIHVYHTFLRPKPPPPTTAPSAFRLAVELALGVFLYDLMFTPVHWFMHNSPSPAIRQLHRSHHEMKGSLKAGATVRHSLIDGSTQVMVNILVQQISPWGTKHIFSRFLHNIAVTYLLTESHSGYDLPFMSHQLVPWLFGGSVRHNAHHNKGNVYYQQFFTYIDDAAGFVEKQ